MSSKRKHTDEKKSYTASLIGHIKAEGAEQGLSDKRIKQITAMIQEFTLDWRKKNPLPERKKYDHLMNFGKYKGLNVSKVVDLDPSYIEWCLGKQRQYLGDDRAADMERLLKARDGTKSGSESDSD